MPVSIVTQAAKKLELVAPATPGAYGLVNHNMVAGDTTLQSVDSLAGEPATADEPYYIHLIDPSEYVVVIGRSGGTRTLAAPLANSHTVGAEVAAYAGPATTPAAAGLMPAADFHKLRGIEKGADRTDETNVAAAGAVMDSDFGGSATGTMRRTGAGAYAVRKDNLAAGGAPTVADDQTEGYEVGSRWIVPGVGELVCLDASTGAAVWVLVATATPETEDHGATTVRRVTGGSALNLETDDVVLEVDLNGEDRNLGLPSPETDDPRRWIVVKVSSDAHRLTLQQGDSETINGAAAALDLPGSQSTRFPAWTVYRDDAGDVRVIAHAPAGIDPPVTESGTTRALSDSDHGRTILCTHASGCAVTVPQTVSPGFTCILIQRGAGQVTIAGSGTMVVTPAATFLVAANTARSAEVGSAACVVVESATVCNVFGDLEAA